MRRKIYIRGLIVAFGLLITQLLFSQKFANNWLVGNFGLEFQNDSVSIRKDYAPHENRGAGIISDQNGDLLFYTDGFSVWNKNHERMPNGDSITVNHTSHSIQLSLVVPKPNSNSLYYVFTVDPWNGQESSGLYYSIVDISLNNGLGDVIQKGTKILDNVTNRFTAVYHSNLNDIWIIINMQNTNNYYSYLISGLGISSPIISSVGHQITLGFDGQLKASPDGQKVACSHNYPTSEGFDLFDFDNITGELSNPMSFKLPALSRGCDGIEFSPDACKLFVYQIGSSGESGLYQFIISSQNYDEINNSRIHLISENFNSFKEMQLAPNGKIYITKGGGGGGTEHLGVIEDPNNYDKACNVNENGLYLEGESSFVVKLPIFIQNYFYKTSFTYDNTCQSSSIKFNITNLHRLDSARWTFGEGSSSRLLNPVFQYTHAGNYNVTLFAYYPGKTDTIVKQIIINAFSPFDLGNDTTVCYGHELSVAEKFKSYHWNTGDTTKAIKINNNGKYKLTVENSFGCFSSDSIFMGVVALPVISLPDTMEMGELDSIYLNGGVFSSYSWNTGEISPSIYVRNEGWYSVSVKNNSGCIAAKSVLVVRNKSIENEENTDWIVLNPKPTLLPGNDVYFINDQTGFIVTNKELFRTKNAASTWEKVMNITSGKRIAFKNMIGYIIGDNGTIYKSTHLGDGWNKLNVNFTDNLNAISLIHQDTVLITSDNKIFISDDGGMSWKINSINGVDIEDSYFTSSRTGHIACKYGSILKTIDSGDNWYVTESTNISPSDFFRITFVNEKIGYATQQHSEIYKTIDAGETWKEIASPDASYGIHFINENVGYIAGEDGAIHKTADGGKTWVWKGFNWRIDGNDIYSIFFIDEDNGFATGLRGRIIKTINSGTSWSEYALTYNDIKQLQFTSIHIGYALVGNELFKTTNKGDKWTGLGPIRFNTKMNAMDFVNDSLGYIIGGGESGTSGSEESVFKTTDGGVTWNFTSKIPSFYENLYAIDFVDNNIGFVSGGYNQKGVFKTSDAGQNWERVEIFSFGQIQFLNGQVGYATNTPSDYSKIYKTIDGGKTWTIKFEIDEDIESFHFIDENIGYLIGDNALLYKTTNGGITWKKLVIPYEYYIDIKFCSNNIGYNLDEEGKLYQTMDGGLNWEHIYNMSGINSIELRDKDIYISGTYGKILKNTIRYDSVHIYLVPVKNALSTKATLKGIVSSNGGEILDIQFQYGLNPLFENSINANPGIMHSNTADSVFVNITNLMANTQYYYRIKISYNGGDQTSNYSTFKTPPEYEMTMNYVNNTSSNDAEVTGKVTSNDAEISNIKFQYSIDTMFTCNIDAIPNSVSGETSKVINGKLLLLEPNTKYYTRIKAIYNGKEIYSHVVNFTTKPEYLISIYSPFINGTDVTLKAFVIPYKDTIDNIVFEYGKTREYLNFVTATPNQILLNSFTIIQANLAGLEPNSVYYYRIKAKQGSNTIYSQENILNLGGGVIIVPVEIQQKSDSSVILQGLVNSNGIFIYNIQFEYGTSEDLGDSIQSYPSYLYDRLTYTIKTSLNSLLPLTKYYFRIKATDGTNIYYSEKFSFTLGKITGIEIFEDINNVEVYPNPTSNYLIIKSPSPIKRVELIDFDGKIREQKINENLLDISDYPGGLYFIRIYTDNEVIIRKIIKY